MGWERADGEEISSPLRTDWLRLSLQDFAHSLHLLGTSGVGVRPTIFIRLGMPAPFLRMPPCVFVSFERYIRTRSPPTSGWAAGSWLVPVTLAIRVGRPSHMKL